MVIQRDVLVYPDPRLREVAGAAADIPSIEGIVADMLHTMYMRDAVGLAATQIGELVQVFVLDGSYFRGRGSDPMVFINPSLYEVSPTMERRREGCLSFPDQPAYTVRPSWVTMQATNLAGETFQVCSKGDTLLSLALQHEFDHLFGILMTDVVDKRQREKLHEAMSKQGV
jgi:peptide deformylase